MICFSLSGMNSDDTSQFDVNKRQGTLCKSSWSWRARIRRTAANDEAPSARVHRRSRTMPSEHALPTHRPTHLTLGITLRALPCLRAGVWDHKVCAEFEPPCSREMPESELGLHRFSLSRPPVLLLSRSLSLYAPERCSSCSLAVFPSRSL